MDRSLRLLIWLRTKGTLRRWKRTFSRPRGIVLGVFTALLVGSWLASVGATAMLSVRPPPGPIRRFAPIGLLAFTVLAILGSSGEQVLYYSPAEVAFLFAGPYRKRQLLAYKLFMTLALCAVSAAFFALGGRMVASSLASAFVGSLLLVLFFQLLQMSLGLAASTAGALAWSRGRRVALAAVLVLVAAAVASAGASLGGPLSLESLERVEASPITKFVVAPFRWFVLVFTAEDAAEMALWSVPCLILDLSLLGSIFLLDASYLEVAAAASARRFRRMQRMLSGGGAVRAGGRSMGRFRYRPPAAPWWGGVGPNFWRQTTTALGAPKRLFTLAGMLVFLPVVFATIAAKEPKVAEIMLGLSIGMISWLSISLSVLLPYDFRGDIDMMEELKALPIAPNRLALGQILTPTLISSAAQAAAMGLSILLMGTPYPEVWAALAFVLPVNLTFFAVENLLFLWYPSRVVAGQFDIMAVGRQILLLMGKVFGLGLGLGLAALAGGLVFFFTRAPSPALVTAWVVMVATGLALVPLVGQAFTKFDVSLDIPA